MRAIPRKLHTLVALPEAFGTSTRGSQPLFWPPCGRTGSPFGGYKPSRIACGSVIGTAISSSELSPHTSRKQFPRRRDVRAIPRKLHTLVALPFPRPLGRRHAGHMATMWTHWKPLRGLQTLANSLWKRHWATNFVFRSEARRVTQESCSRWGPEREPL